MTAFDLDKFSNIGNILLRRGVITKKQLKRALEEQDARKSALLGELLVELKLVSQDEVDDALREQEAHRVPPPSDDLRRAQDILGTAIQRVSYEADRLTETRQKPKPAAPRVMELKISPDEV